MWGLHWFVSVSQNEHVWRPGGPGCRCGAAGRRVERRGGPRPAWPEPNQWVNELCFACCRTQSAGEICEDIPLARVQAPHSRTIDNDNVDNVDNDCFTVQMGSTAILFRFLIDISPTHSPRMIPTWLHNTLGRYEPTLCLSDHLHTARLS